jgi:hypothetical protein
MTKQAPKQTKYSLFDFLNVINSANLKKFEGLSETDKKTNPPFLINQWLSGVLDKRQIQCLNHIVNPLIFSFYHHPDLLYKLMMASCTGGDKRFNYPKKKKKENISTELGLIRKYYQCSLTEAKQYQTLLSKDDIMEIAQEMGEDEEVIKKLSKNDAD